MYKFIVHLWAYIVLEQCSKGSRLYSPENCSSSAIVNGGDRERGSSQGWPVTRVLARRQRRLTRRHRRVGKTGHRVLLGLESERGNTVRTLVSVVEIGGGGGCVGARCAGAAHVAVDGRHHARRRHAVVGRSEARGLGWNHWRQMVHGV